MGALSTAALGAPTLLTQAHDCSAFACHHPVLAEWLQRRALANQVGGASRTYVVCHEGQEVVGYYAIAPGAVMPEVATGAVRRNMPSPVPVFVLGRLSVHKDCGGLGIGTGLLKDAVLRCAQAASIAGGRAILCHAIDEEARGFYLKHGFQPSPLEPLTVMLGLKDVGKLLSLA